MAKEFQVTFDCADAWGLAEFWCDVLGYVIEPPPAGFDSWEATLDAWGVAPDQRNNLCAIVDPDRQGPRIFFQKVPEGKTVKNRVHLDVRAAADAQSADERMTMLETACERLVGRGASRIRRVDPDPPMESGYIVMADLEGNEFCLD